MMEIDILLLNGLVLIPTPYFIAFSLIKFVLMEILSSSLNFITHFILFFNCQIIIFLHEWILSIYILLLLFHPPRFNRYQIDRGLQKYRRITPLQCHNTNVNTVANSQPSAYLRN